MSCQLAKKAGRVIAAATLALALSGHTVFAQAPVMNPPGSPPAQAATTEDIRDIRGPKPIASVWLLPLIGIAAVLIAAGGYGTWRWYRRRRDLRRRSPSDIALERLEKARALMQPAGGRAYSIEVSGIVREYIEARFEVMAVHLTTDEFLRELLTSTHSLLASHRDVLGEFLQSCDLAKFGGWNLMEDHMEAMLQSARRFVIESTAPAKPKSRQSEPASADSASASRATYDSLPTT